MMTPHDDLPDLPPESDWKSEFEEFSDRPSEPAATDAFRDALGERLGREVARHGSHKQWRRIAAALAIFAAGWLVGAWPETSPSPAPPQNVAEPENPTDAPSPSPKPEVPVDPKVLDRALASVEPALRPERLAEAGDAYLDGEQANPSAALYFYQQALDANPDAPAVELDDSWLLKALKADRQ